MLTPRHVKELGTPWTEIRCMSQLNKISNDSSDTVLVAFDVEGWTESVNEIGLAYQHIRSSTTLKVLQHGDVDAFHDQNHVEAHRSPANGTRPLSEQRSLLLIGDSCPRACRVLECLLGGSRCST
jgi:hypothetical protein